MAAVRIGAISSFNSITGCGGGGAAYWLEGSLKRVAFVYLTTFIWVVIQVRVRYSGYSHGCQNAKRDVRGRGLALDAPNRPCSMDATWLTEGGCGGLASCFFLSNG